LRDAHNGRMDLRGKLQIKPGTVVCAVGVQADGPDLSDAWPAGPAREAGAVIAFVHQTADLPLAAQDAIEAALQDRLAWVAYPKSGQLGTDLNRDRLAAALKTEGIRPVRQVALDDVWSAPRFRPA
jgi:hypothetical protein